METIEYKIEFFSNWHCGSGLAAGADVDTLVVKDKDGLPYVPGRTIKGLLRDALIVVSSNISALDNVFGISGDKAGHKTGRAYFTNATLPDSESKYIVSQDLTSHLYQSFSSTAIEEDGIAKDHSLRKTETVVPCTVYGQIYHVPEEYIEDVEKAMKFIKRMGTGRNRGFGRCCISIEERKEEKS